jgi:hypothetical protein
VDPLNPIEYKKNTKRKYQKRSKVKENKLEKEIDILTCKKLVIDTNKKVNPRSKWNIIELAEDISFEEHFNIIEHYMFELFGKNVQYFFPLYREKIGDKTAILSLFDGYFFVQSNEMIIGFPDRFRNECIKGPMKKNTKVVEVLGIKINDLKKELQLRLKELIPKRKQIVIPKIGIFGNLEGEVLSVDRKNLFAIVKFQYATRIVEAPISFINLTLK